MLLACFYVSFNTVSIWEWTAGNELTLLEALKITSQLVKTKTDMVKILKQTPLERDLLQVTPLKISCSFERSSVLPHNKFKVNTISYRYIK